MTGRGVMTGSSEREVDTSIEEVRLALALNGGVSLAVWMGGCAVELDRARRTSASAAVGAATPAASTTYSSLCQAFRRELVIDVMTGASAGGINGALLAAAMTTGRVLDADYIRDRWLALGDFSKLLQPLSESRPVALMRGDFFERELDRTFAAVMDSDADLPSGPVGAPLVPALDVTATDITGTVLTFRDDWAGVLSAREHRVRFKFREAGDYTNAKLAAAARASASFPLAFAPYEVSDEKVDGIEALAGLNSKRWVIDGGLLDNAPIRAALNLIPERPATRQVKRFLCYVNGDPDGAADRKEDAGGEPGPASVIGAIINLPRKAPFADHLLALQDMAKRSATALEAELALLALDLDVLEATAQGLLPAYRRRRRLSSIRDLLPEPGDSERVFKILERRDLELPWIPDALDTREPGKWRWGFMAAQRIQHFALDLIRLALEGAGEGTRAELLRVRSRVDQRSLKLDAGRRDFEEAVRPSMLRIADDGAAATEVVSMAAAARSASADLLPSVVETAADLYSLGTALASSVGFAVPEALFGSSDVMSAAPPPEAITHFLQRVLAIEVVRRSFSDHKEIDDGQEIAFAQLTPEAPDLIFTECPLSEQRSPSAGSKLCGTLLGHFSGFHRRSWRANDFLWGRLDAAARIVEMLVSSARTESLARNDEAQPWAALAFDLARGSPEQVALVEEALADVPGSTSEEGRSLEVRLHAALADDLTRGEGHLTRAVCIRAIQFEILREELCHLVEEVAADQSLGSSQAVLGLSGLDLGTEAGVLQAVRRLREGTRTFPDRLGRDSPDEHTSDLAVRTVAHAGLVGLGIARQAGGAPARPVTALRSVLLPVAGAVSRRVPDRVAVVAAFWAAALFLAARIITTSASPADLEAVKIPELALTAVSLLVVAGTAGVPLYRALIRRGVDRVWQIVMFLAIAASGFVGAAVLATVPGPLSVAQLIVAPGAHAPPWLVVVLPVALGAGIAVTGPVLIRKLVGEFDQPSWRGTWSLLTTFLAAAVVACWAWPLVTDGLSAAWWQAAAAWLALAGAPASALIYLVLWPALKGQKAAL